MMLLRVHPYVHIHCTYNVIHSYNHSPPGASSHSRTQSSTPSFSSCMLFSPLHPLTNAQYPHLCRGPADLAIDGQRSQPQ